MGEIQGRYYARRGYAVAIQDCRGRFGSEGVWEPFINEPKDGRSEEHTSELQSPCNLVCRLLLEKKKKKNPQTSQLLITHIEPTPRTSLAQRSRSVSSIVGS